MKESQSIINNLGKNGAVNIILDAGSDCKQANALSGSSQPSKLANLNPLQYARLDLNKKSLPKPKTIQIFRVYTNELTTVLS